MLRPMGLLAPLQSLRDWRRERKRKRVGKQIHAGLQKAHGNAITLSFSPHREKLIILSDQHKGARDGADDFQRCERSYNAALTYYERLGYRLILLGDVEELWENSIEKVTAEYPETLELEAAFVDDSGERYTRIWGNHDVAWKGTDLFQQKMGKHGVGDVSPVEAVRLQLDGLEGGPRELFLTHGHQGTDDSDRNARLSKFFVRHGWTRLQRMLNRPWNTPAVDWGLRGEHANHMYEWALDMETPLIAGHTHLPVFFDSKKKEKPVSAVQPVDDREVQAALEEARAQWAKTEKKRLARQAPIKLEAPCYFNTGCCSFGDGDITGMELRDGEIRLVRWPCEPTLSPEKLATMKLADVFDGIDAAAEAARAS